MMIRARLRLTRSSDSHIQRSRHRDGSCRGKEHQRAEAGDGSAARLDTVAGGCRGQEVIATCWPTYCMDLLWIQHGIAHCFFPARSYSTL